MIAEIQVDGNFRRVRIGNMEAYFSYNTLIALVLPSEGVIYSQNPQGAASGKHCAMVPGWKTAKEEKRLLPVSEFEKRVKDALAQRGIG